VFSFRQRTGRRARLAQSAAVCLVALGAFAITEPVAAQTPTVPVAPSTTIASGPNLGMLIEANPTGSAPALNAPGTLRSAIVVSNPSPSPLVNLQMVIRFGNRPDQIVNVNDGSGTVGVVDPVSGSWYHTIASIPPTTTFTYVVTWNKVCPGRWVIAARVSDRIVSQTHSWVGSADARCSADESVSPQPLSFYALPWPTIAPTSSTSPILPPVTTTTFGPLVSTTLATGLVPGSSTTTTLPLGSTTVATTIVPTTVPAGLVSTTAKASTTTTILRLPAPTSSTIARPTTTKSSRPTTSIELLCKTIGGRRYCGPKSSAYKPGQQKAQELKPGQKPPKTKAKPKAKAKTKKK
jgi:hypothetical protein